MTDEGAVVSGYDVVLVDLDGVLYVGAEAVPGAVEAVAALRSDDVAVWYVTNNASRTPETVAAHLRELGFGARDEAVVTSAQAAAGLIAEQCGAGARVLVVGASALAKAVVDEGLVVVTSADDEPDAVVQGYSPELTYPDLAEGALAVHRGAWWVATNVDSTLPTERGLLPGNGALVSVIAVATGTQPTVAGKPARPLLDAAVSRSRASRPLFVGDRLDTDIDGARAYGMDSVLVLTGVSGLLDVMRAPARSRPTYVVPRLTSLLEPRRVARHEARHDAAATSPVEGRWRCDGWEVQLAEGGTLVVSDDATAEQAGDGSATQVTDGEGHSAEGLVAALVAAAWGVMDAGEEWTAVRASPGSPSAAAELAALGV